MKMVEKLIKVRLFRPFSSKYLLQEIPRTVKNIAVLDRTKEPGSNGEPLYLDVVSALADSDDLNPRLTRGRYGLGSKDTQPGDIIAVYDNMAAIERMDRDLGELFRYIEEHYAEDEYIINAYSDHGISIHSADPFFFSDERCGTALMVRGAGVPALGVTDELVSSLDLHAIVMHEAGLPVDETLDANLPAAFGGKAREYVISNSVFPGQTYKLDIRTKAHEFRLETKDLTRLDGTINMSAYSWRLYEREGHREIWSDALRDKFLAIAWQHVASFAHL